MNKKLLLLLLFFCLTKAQSSAQTGPAPLKIFKFGKIDPGEFKVKGSGQDSAAAAIKIFDTGKGSFEVSTSADGFVYVMERHVRYKIMNKNAYDLADLEIPLYTNNQGSDEKLYTINGATYNLENGKIVTTRMSSDAKFSSRLDKNHILKKFTLPNVKEGSIIEFTYITKSDFTFQLDDWYFQGQYPCLYSSFSLSVPQYYRYKINLKDYIGIKRLAPKETPTTYFVPSTTTSKGGGSLDATMVTNQYYAENIPSIKNESYITTLEDYISKIGFELNSTTFPWSGSKDYTSTWENIVTDKMKHANFGGFISKNNYEKNLLPSIIKKETDPEKKMNLIFNYVKNNIKWDGKYSDYTNQPNQKSVYQKKSGNSAEINLCLLSLLNDAGIFSYPVLISTRRNGAHPGYPLASKFNNVIVLANVGEKNHLLDATDKNNVEDLVSYQNLNHQGLMIKMLSNEAEWISTEQTAVSKTVITCNVKLDTANKLTGTIYLTSSNYAGLDRRNSYQSAPSEEEFIKGYKVGKQGLEISNYKISNLDTPELDLQESMDIDIEDNVEGAGSLVYFMPMLFERTKENPFKLEERNFPVDFAYPLEEDYRINIEFPESYKLEKLPKSEKFVLPENSGSFSIAFLAEGNRMAITSKIHILKSMFSTEEYMYLKELYKNIVRKQAEQIVFKKP